jgi:hypothetical protein
VDGFRPVGRVPSNQPNTIIQKTNCSIVEIRHVFWRSRAARRNVTLSASASAQNLLHYSIRRRLADLFGNGIAQSSGQFG